jgi:proline iminopeptidase
MLNVDRRALFLGGAAASLAACSPTSTAPGAIKEETGRADVPGGKVWWMRAGAVGAKKTPLLVLHGGPGTGHNYLLPLKALADERSVVFYDQLGCGKSDAPENDSLYTIPRSVEELAAVRKALGLDKMILYGHSWGSVLAIEYLLSMGSDGVEALVMGGAIPSIPQASAGMQRLIAALPSGAGQRLHELEAAGQKESKEYQDLVGLFYQTHLCRTDPWSDDVNASLENLGKSPAYRVMNGPNEFTIVGTIKDWDRTADLGQIALPTLLTTGEHDEITLDCHQTIQKAVKGSELLIFGDCSHLTMNEKPEAYVKALRGFLA